MRKKTQRLIKALVSVAFFAFLFHFVNARQLAQTLKDMDGLYFSLSILLAVLMIFSSCLKWKISVKLTGGNVKFRRLCSIYLIGYYFSNLLPSNIGGDVVRSYYLGRTVESQSQAAASVFIERVSGMLFLLLLTATVPILRKGGYASPYLAFPALGAAALLFLFTILVFIPRPVDRLQKIATAILRWLHIPADCWLDRLTTSITNAIRRVYEKIANAVKTAHHDKRTILQIVLLTMWFYALTWVNVYWAFRTFGAYPTFIEIASVTPAIMVVSMIPVSLGSLGLAEGAYVLYFSMIGMEPSDALAVGLFMRFKVLLVGIVGSWFYLIHKHDVNRDMLEQAEARTHA